MTGSIPYGRHLVTDDDVLAVVQVLKGDWLTTGPTIRSFERALAAVSGAKDVVVVSSGTAALHLAYLHAEIGPGDQVITSPLTFAGTAYPALQMGATISFADVDQHLALDAAAASAAITSKTKAIVPVDYAGHPADLEALARLADSAGGILLQDAAHSLGATYRGQPISTTAAMSIFSFHPVKAITSGEGGAIATNEEGAGRILRSLRDHGLVRQADELVNREEGPWHQEIQRFGLNYRMSDLQAALGLSQLGRLSEIVRARQKLAERYLQLLDAHPLVKPVLPRSATTSAWHIFVVRVPSTERRRVFEGLRSRGIGVQVHYLPVYLHPIFQDAGYQRGACPNAEQAYSEMITLPLFPTMTDDMQDRVVSELLDLLGA
jgi:UDP-4-amino-4,6-dideoxy-N-acetyl-beta-L-altrosamine transaminase